jgi:hypothetical protein
VDGSGVSDYEWSHSVEMLRCGCGTKYLIRQLPDRETNELKPTFFDWFDEKQAFGQKCVLCGADLAALRRRAIWEAEKEKWLP